MNYETVPRDLNYCYSLIILNGCPPKISLRCLLLIQSHHKMKSSKSPGRYLISLLKLSGPDGIRAHIKAIEIIMEKFQRRSQRSSRYTVHTILVIWLLLLKQKRMQFKSIKSLNIEYMIEEPLRCQQWFLKHVFYVPEFAPKRLLLKLSRLNSIESEIALKKLLFLGCLITGQKMTPALQSLFELRSKSLFDANTNFLGVLPVFVRLCTNLICFFILTSGFRIQSSQLTRLGN